MRSKIILCNQAIVTHGPGSGEFHSPVLSAVKPIAASGDVLISSLAGVATSYCHEFKIPAGGRGKVTGKPVGTEGVMSQAEIAGGAVTPSNELPSKGYRMHDFVLKSALGGSIQLSDYRGRANLVLIVADDRPETTKLLADAGDHYPEIKDENAEVLAIVRAAVEQAAGTKQRLKLPYPVLADEDGRVLRQLGGTGSGGRDLAAVYVTDRFGEVFGAYRRRDGQPLPAIADILNWLEFVNSQCPECEPPEWPA